MKNKNNNNCSRRLTFSPVDLSGRLRSNLSPLDFVMRLLVALERGSVGTNGVLPVDHTSTIK